MNEPETNDARSIDLPPHIEEPLEVYVNGVRQQQGTDYELVGHTLRFARPLSHEGKLGMLRWLSMFLGIAGTYRTHETVDIIYQRNGQRLVESVSSHATNDPRRSWR